MRRRGKWRRIERTKRERRRGRGKDTKGQRQGTGERRGQREERKEERDVGAPTILINPVPGTENRSRSNRVHDLQGIYIRSSTRGYNSIPSLYSALEEPLIGRAPWGPARQTPRCTHNLRRWSRHGSYAPLISSKIEDSSLTAALAGSPRQPGSAGLILSFVWHVTYRRQ